MTKSLLLCSSARTVFGIDEYVDVIRVVDGSASFADLLVVVPLLVDPEGTRVSRHQGYLGRLRGW